MIKALTCMMFFTFAMTTDAVGSIIPTLLEEFALSLRAASAFHYVPMIAIAAGALGLGFLADRIAHEIFEDRGVEQADHAHRDERGAPADGRRDPRAEQGAGGEAERHAERIDRHRPRALAGLERVGNQRGGRRDAARLCAGGF